VTRGWKAKSVQHVNARKEKVQGVSGVDPHAEGGSESHWGNPGGVRGGAERHELMTLERSRLGQVKTITKNFLLRHHWCRDKTGRRKGPSFF